MGKKGKKQTHVSILDQIDDSIDESYETLKEEIEAMQIRIAIADAEADRQIKKKLKHNPNYIVTNKKKISIRNQVLREMDETNFFDRVTEALQIITPMVVVIARMVAILIQLILSIPGVREKIPTSILEKIMKLHDICASIRFS